MRSRILLFMLLVPLVGIGQSNKIRRLIKKENFDEARDYAESKLTGAKKDQRSIPYMMALGQLHSTLGDIQMAGSYYADALQLVEQKIESGEKLVLADYDIIDEVSLYYIESGNLIQARNWIEYSLTNRVGKWFKNNPTHFRPYLAKGLLFYVQDQLDSAEKYLDEYVFNIRNSNYTKYLEIDKYADGYYTLSEINYMNGDYNRAKRFSKRAARLQKHSWTKRDAGKNTIKRVQALNGLTKVYLSMGKVSKAQLVNDKAYKLYLRNIKSDLPVLAELLVNRAELHLIKNDIYNVKELIKKAAHIETTYINENFPLLSEYEKEIFQVRHKRVFNSINMLMIQALDKELLTATDDFWKNVLDFNTRTKGLILNESSRLYQFQRLLTGELKEDMDEWKLLKNEFAFRVSSLQYKKDTGVLDSLESRIISLEKGLLQAIGPSSVDSLSIDRVTEKIDNSDRVVELLRVDTSSAARQKGDWSKENSSAYLVFIIDKEGFNRVNILKNGWELENRLIFNYRNSLQYDVQDTISYNAFWKSLGLDERRNGKVYISPDGIYNLVNFDNIWNPTSQKYLFEEIDFINITSIRRLSENYKEKGMFHSNVCLIGNPDFTKFPYPQPQVIPETALEVNEVELMVKKNDGNAIVLMGDRASEHELKKLKDCSMVHMATHGVFKRDATSRNPMMNSGILLGIDTTRNEDGILTAYEASALNLSEAKMVVLSACDTGLGEVQSGEGVYGLQRAFEVNGVDYTLMSMWKVDDLATREFMREFYRELLESEKSPHQSIVEAQKILKDKYENPYYWGAFKLIGFRSE